MIRRPIDMDCDSFDGRERNKYPNGRTEELEPHCGRSAVQLEHGPIYSCNSVLGVMEIFRRNPFWGICGRS